jgi:leader peptidase (prepilin peptidase)/N-methyltransferase
MQIVDLLQQSPALFLAVATLLGFTVGSFLNVVAYRLPIMLERDWKGQCRELLQLPTEGGSDAPLNLSRPRSFCPNCNHKITALENIPVLSYLFLRGRCSQCDCAISIRYPIVEALTALLSIIVAWHFGPTWQGAAALFLTWVLIALSLIDIDHQLLPDNIVLPAIWVGLFLSLFTIFTDPESAILGALCGYLSLWSIFKLFKLVTGKEGMGYGDFKLLALFGAWQGWQFLLQIVLLSSLVGALFGMAMILFRGRDRTLPIPFGPYLAAAGWISLLWGQQINNLYLQWAGLA